MAAELVRVAYAPGLPAPEDAHAFRLRGMIVARAAGAPLVSASRMTVKDGSVASLAGGGDGWTLRYGVRVRDRRGRPSALVVCRDLVATAPPAAPEDLRAEATADGIRLAWKARVGAAESGFNVYRSLADEPPGERPLNRKPLPQAEFLDTSVTIGSDYRYVVRAVVGESEPFRESESSDPVTVVAEDRFPPATPTGLTVVQEGTAVRLFWDPSAERDLGGYQLYRRVADGPWTALTGEPLVEATYLDRNVAAGRHVEYRVAAVDRAAPPNESQPSAPEGLDVVEDPAVRPESPR